jgi:hypothetical protein
MFSTAKPIAAAKPAKKAAKTSKVVMEGLERYAVLDAAMKTFKARQEIYETKLKNAMAKIFVATGCKDGKKPSSFNAEEGIGQGSMQLKLRGAGSKLSDEEAEILDDEKIPYETIKVVEETFVINPEYAGNMELLGAIEAALKKAKIKNLPEDLFMRQEGVEKRIVTEDSIEAVFALPEKKAARLLPLVTCLAIRPKVTGEFGGILEEILAEGEDD